MITKKKTIKITIVEDDHYFNRILTKYVTTICNERVYFNLKFEVNSFKSAHSCIENLDDETDIMILDFFLFDEEELDVLTGMDVLEKVKKHCPHCKVIIVSSLKDPGTIAKIMEEGIYEYVDKNVNSTNRIGAILQSVVVKENNNVNSNF